MGEFLESERTSRLIFWRLTRIPVSLLLAWFTFQLTLGKKDWIFLDGANWFIHEAGHFAFSFAPQSLYIFGGTLGQLALPVGLGVYFWYRRTDAFAAAVMTWWFGENLTNVSRYLGDAALEHLPITGEIHDWAYLAREFHFLSSADEMATGLRGLSILLMAASLFYVARMAVLPSDAALEGSLQAEPDL